MVDNLPQVGPVRPYIIKHQQHFALDQEIVVVMALVQTPALHDSRAQCEHVYILGRRLFKVSTIQEKLLQPAARVQMQRAAAFLTPKGNAAVA